MQATTINTNLTCWCGTPIKQFKDLHCDFIRVGCPECKWTTFLGDPEQCWPEAERIIEGVNHHAERGHQNLL